MTTTESDRGAVPREEWIETEVHQASAYFCGKCGREFDTPHDFYDHLDTEHAKEKGKRR